MDLSEKNKIKKSPDQGHLRVVITHLCDWIKRFEMSLLQEMDDVYGTVRTSSSSRFFFQWHKPDTDTHKAARH